MKLRSVSLVLLCIATDLAHGAAEARPPQAGARLVPVADHHQHLISPAAANTRNEPALPAIPLPDDLARLLSERARRWNDKAALAELYTEDSLVLDPFGPLWIRGGSEAAGFLSELFDTPYRITPVAYGVDGSSGHVAGYLSEGEGAATKHFGQVLLSLVKGRDGRWRIAAESPTFPGPQIREPVTAEQVVKQLDEAGMDRAVVLSVAYWFGSPRRKPSAEEYANVRAENDWVAREAARFPKRLVAFCSFNPLKDYALEELDRCSKKLRVRGFKLHFGNSGVDLRKPEHVEKVRRVFRAANAGRLAMVVHLWTDPAYEREGREHAEIFLKELLPAAPDVTVQIAHMAGGGRSTDPALAVFAEAIAAKNPTTTNLYFDVATLTAGQTDEGLRKDAMRMRQIGLNRILYGTDTVPPNPPPRRSWATFRSAMPLTEEELRTIASNVAPYLR